MDLDGLRMQLEEQHKQTLAQAEQIAMAIRALSGVTTGRSSRVMGRGKRNLSAAARARIAAAQRARWSKYHAEHGVTESDVKRRKKHWTQTAKGRAFMRKTANARFKKQ